MKHYYIRSNSSLANYLTILNENEDGYMVRIYRDMDGYEHIVEDFMPYNLFESCLRTGYISEISDKELSAIA